MILCLCVCLQLPRAVSTQALSGAGFLKMINKATDAVSKMTIKMNESDVVSEHTHAHTPAAHNVSCSPHSCVVDHRGSKKICMFNTEAEHF